jgi:hypothetical protein
MIRQRSRFEPAYRIKKKINTIDHAKLNNPNELKERLIKEMLELDKQRIALETDGQKFDFSMMQVYKEMIQSRRLLLEQLSSAIN